MSKVFKRGIFLAFFLAVACGKFKDPKDSDQISSQLANDPAVFEAKKFASRSGTLTLIPDSKGLDGLVNYTIYENGLVVYHGYIKYRPYAYYNYERVESFEGRYKADARTFLSATYAELGNSHSDFKLVMNVNETKDNLNVVDITVREQPDATGRFEVDTHEKLIDIHYAEVTGKVMGEAVTIRVRK